MPLHLSAVRLPQGNNSALSIAVDIDANEKPLVDEPQSDLADLAVLETIVQS